MDPGIDGLVVADDLSLLEPVGDLLLSRISGIRSVDDVPADINAEVSADGPGKRVVGIGGTNEGTSSLDHVAAYE